MAGGDGKIVDFDRSEAIYADPKVEYTRRLIAATPKDDIEHNKAPQQQREAAHVS